MARNSLAPGYLKFFYTTNGHPHLQVLPVNPVSPAGNATNLTDSGASAQLWTSAVADLVLLMKVVMNTADSIDSAEIWTQATPTSTPIFQASATVGVSGTNGGAAVPFCQLHMAFRSANGGRAVYQLMETYFAIDRKDPAPLYNSNSYLQAIDSYLTGNSSVVWARDNSYISSGIRSVTKLNDKLRKKYFLN